MADKKLLLFYISLISVATGDQLTPFIAWSNNEILSSVDHTTDIDNIISKVTSSNIKMVILFGCEDLSFDDIVKFGGVFDDKGVNGFTNLKNSMDLAPYQYWTGLRLDSRNWVSNLVSGLGLSMKYLDPKDIVSEDGFYIISSEKCIDEDVIIGEVMEKLEGFSYLAIFTHYNRMIEKRSLPNMISVSEDEGVNVTIDSNTNCPFGGILRRNITDDSDPCLLFCLKGNIAFQMTQNCSLSRPSTIKWCCEFHINNNTTDRFDHCLTQSHPSVELHYTIDGDNNNCADLNILNVSLQFMFPKDNSTSRDEKWAITINATTYSSPDITQYPPDEAEDDEEYEIVATSVLVRQNPSDKLYQKFGISIQFSYACAVEQYNTYITSNYSSADDEVYSLADDQGNVTVILKAIQVQPYNVKSNSFSVADNCIGYFTYVTWMGIVSVLVLLLILYVSILCVFSMKTIDQFEDPRGQTISVEKLH